MIKSKGLLYWTKQEMDILMSNLDKSIDELSTLLPARSKGAIYGKLRYETSKLTFKGKVYSLREIKANKLAHERVLKIINKKKVTLPQVKGGEVQRVCLSVGNIEITMDIKTCG